LIDAFAPAIENEPNGEGLLMSVHRPLLWGLALALVGLLFLDRPRPSQAYIGGPPLSLGMMCSWSSHAAVARIDAVDREKGVVIFRKVRDVKGKWPADVFRHVYPANFPNRAYILNWAEVKKTVVVFALASYKWSHAYIDSEWYAAHTGDWKTWTVAHSEPLLLRMYCGKTDRLADAITTILAGKEVVVPCMVDGNLANLQKRQAARQRLRASLKLLDYNPRRDFAGPGGDEFVGLAGMPAFSHLSPLGRSGADAQAVSVVDFDGDGRNDLCLVAGSRVGLWRNGGDYFHEIALPATSGARAAVWADYNGDGKPDLFLASPRGPRLYTNLGTGFRDDTHLLPVESGYNLTCAAWIDSDGDGKPDLLLGNGWYGLRLYRNRGKADPLPAGFKPGQPVPERCRWFEDVSAGVGLGPDGIGSRVKGDTLTVCDVNGDDRPDFLYGAGSGLLVLNTPRGFREASESGISYRAGGVGPVFGDFDGDGHPDLFVPQKDGGRLFRNDGKGKFTDVTARSGDLAKLTAHATSAAWGDLDNDGHLDLVIGCLRGPNRYFRNKGDGTFEDATRASGLNRRIFNTQAVALADVNGDGALDVVFNNEGQDSCVLLGKPAGARAVLTVRIAGSAGVAGASVRVASKEGKLIASQQIGCGLGRGGQDAPQARFALVPGRYQVTVRYSSGVVRGREIVLGSHHLKDTIDDRTAVVK
jgi:hypothetical protein